MSDTVSDMILLDTSWRLVQHFQDNIFVHFEIIILFGVLSRQLQ